MLKEIGSNFWCDVSVLQDDLGDSVINMLNYGISGEDVVFLSTGRAAILYAIKDIKKAKDKGDLIALIPSYTCDTVLQPFLDENIVTYAYDINEKLEINEKSFIEKMDEFSPDIVLIHRYFGFDNSIDINDKLQMFSKIGCIFIEDRTQSLFSDYKTLDVDYIVGSFRKWTALPDGGFCVKKKRKFVFDEIPKCTDDLLITSKLKAFQQKNDYMLYNEGEKEEFLNSYRVAEEILNKEKKFFCMSDISKHLLRELDVAWMIEKRRQNYSFFVNNINNHEISCVMGELPDGVVPLYLLIRSPHRNELQIELRKHAIYAPIVWPKPEKMPPVSKLVDDIYKEVLCLPVDQRYDIDDMDRMVSVVNDFNFMGERR